MPALPDPRTPDSRSAAGRAELARMAGGASQGPRIAHSIGGTWGVWVEAPRGELVATVGSGSRADAEGIVAAAAMPDLLNLVEHLRITLALASERAHASLHPDLAFKLCTRLECVDARTLLDLLA
jgi:hypothetical protein